MADAITDVPAAARALATSHYRAELHRWLVRRLRNPENADDVLQEVFTRALRINNADYVKKPLAYLFGIAFHVIAEHQIREDHERRISLDSPTAADSLRDHPALMVDDDFAERLSLQRQLEKALKELPQQYRAVLLLCKRDGMSYAEAAKVTHLSVHTVEKYLIRAKAMLMGLNWDR